MESARPIFSLEKRFSHYELPTFYVDGKVPETMHCITADDDELIVPGKIVNDCEVLRQAFETTPYEASMEYSNIRLPCKTQHTHGFLKVLSLFDTDKQYVPCGTLRERRDFVRENQHAFKFLKTLSPDNLLGITCTADILNSPRIIDTCLIFFLMEMEGKSIHEIRQMFNFRDNYTEEEEKEIRKRHELAND